MYTQRGVLHPETMLSRLFRYAALVVIITILLHLILAAVHNEYREATASGLSRFSSHFQEEKLEGDLRLLDDANSQLSSTPSSHNLMNATFIMLVRNSDLEGTITSIRAIEDRFNSRFGYPYALLNDEPFTDEFKRRVSVITPSEMKFGVVPKEHWSQPEWIDVEKAEKAMKQMELHGVKYGGSMSSWFPETVHSQLNPNAPQEALAIGTCAVSTLVQPYKWYWRIEPDVKFYCDIHRDPFRFMEENNKVYGKSSRVIFCGSRLTSAFVTAGFTIAVYEISATIRTLWKAVTDFINTHPEFIADDNAMGFISDTNGVTYNRCHFWSNFEIANMDFWRGPAYTAFFEYLDSLGGFYYERWGDAPVHSIAASSFLTRDQIHFFEEIGYQHDDWGHCPIPDDIWEKGRCSCSQDRSFGSSCEGALAILLAVLPAFLMPWFLSKFNKKCLFVVMIITKSIFRAGPDWNLTTRTNFLFSLILFAISCARINYTLHLPRGDPLNGGRDFYGTRCWIKMAIYEGLLPSVPYLYSRIDPVVPELIVTTLISMLPFPRMYGDELIGLTMLWLLWIGGAAAASQFQACQLLSALEAFAWLGWLVLSGIIAISIVVILQSRSGRSEGLAEPLPTRDGRSANKEGAGMGVGVEV
ncbi:hypothetical protein D9757_012617 [Collybiopsis confluens]|uniref:Glycosyltransferase family 15 protein n=1 Tax=Collybiopsis confluens TaxID=2823264 RepID=A0A8H5LPY1_9AGAR|nr:hypothetical protein D9757_012617 [Collybiopsis confluens]